MATAPLDLSASRPGGPNPKLVFGCGAGCCVVLLAILALFAFSAQRQKQLNQVGRDFVEAAGGGDLKAAYALLHGNLRATKSFGEFETEWTAARAALGEFQGATPKMPRADLEQAQMIVPYQLNGEAHTLEVDVAINPNDKPMMVVGYSLPSSLPFAPGTAPPPTDTAPAPPTTAEAQPQ